MVIPSSLRRILDPFFVEERHAVYCKLLQSGLFRNNSAQDIVTASPNFDVGEFVPQLREFLAVHDTKQCMFLLRWVTLLVR